jgi:hypothetical protein
MPGMTTADLELAGAAPRPYVPWLQRAIRASGLSPWLAGLGVAALQLASLFAVFGLGGLVGLRDIAQPWFWSELAGPNVVNALLIGYAPAALAWSRRSALAQLERLRPELAEADFVSFHAQLAGYPRALLALVGGLFAALIVPLVMFDPQLRTLFAESTPLARAWVLWVNALVGWLMARAILEEVRVALLFARMGDRLERVDLFDLGPLEPFARRAVEGVLVWVIGASLTSILFAGGWASATLPQLVGAIVLMALVAFALPLLGVHRRIRAAKHQELERIHAAARAERDALLAGGPGTRLPALLALRSQVADVREWPVDLSTLMRLLLYLGIGLGSWVGAALVDVVIEAVLR